MTAPNDDLLWQHLRTLPAFRALLRAVEARFYQRLDLPEPILDLGCGDGHFARLALPDKQLVGIDPWWGPLQKARRDGPYQLALQALGHRLPFPDNHFATLISNSVLEHIPDVEPVLQDAARVLQPNGRFVFTMPSHHFTANLGGALFLRRLGGEALADRYRHAFNRISRHAHTDDAATWARRLGAAGLVVDRWQYYFSPAALHALEWGHLQGLPSAALHALTGHWVVAPWDSNLRPVERWLRPFYDEPPAEDGAYLLLVGRKAAAHPVTITLPAMQPLDLTVAQSPPDLLPALPLDPPQEHRPLTLEPLPHAPPPPARVLSPAWRPVLLIALAVGAAILAQLQWRSAPETPGGATFWLLVALGALVALRRGSRPLSPRVILPRYRRRYAYFGSFLLVLLAQSLVAGPPEGHQPYLALLAWLTAAVLAAWSLGPVKGLSTSVLAAKFRHARRSLAITAALGVAAFAIRLFDLTRLPFILNGSEASLGLDAVAVLDGRLTSPFVTGWLSNPTLPSFLLAPFVSLFGQTVLAIRLPSAIGGALTVALAYFLGRRVWGERPALLAAVFLLAGHFHLHYSRLGLTNVWDGFWLLLALGLTTLAWQRGGRVRWLAAGAALGFNAYFFTAVHLLPLILLPWALWLWLTDPARTRHHARNMLAGALLALIIALPQLRFYIGQPELFMERANALSLIRGDRLAALTAAPEGATAVLADHFRRAALAFHATLDNDAGYNPGRPLLGFWPGVLALLGFGLALLHARRARDAVLLLWLAVTIIFAGALLENPPVSHRLVVAAPVLALLAGRALAWLFERLPSLPLPRQRATAALLLLAFLLTAGDLLFYFGRYQNGTGFGDRNSEIAYEMAGYLEALDGGWDAYFFGPPSMYVSFPTLSYLAPDFSSGINLFDMIDDGPPLPEQPANNIVLIFLPERSAELSGWQARYPGGTLRTVEGVFATPLFLAYEVVP